MMMIAPNSLVHQKEGTQKEEEEGEQVEEKEVRCQARTLPQNQLGQGYRMRGTGENMDGGVGRQSTGGAEGARDHSYPLTIGMEGATERRPTL